MCTKGLSYIRHFLRYRDSRSRRFEQGLSLIELLITVTIVATAAATMASLYIVFSKSKSRETLLKERTEARNTLLSDFDCVSTVTPTPDACIDSDATPFLPVQAKPPLTLPAQPRTLVRDPLEPHEPGGPPGGYTLFGHYTYLRARCVDCPTCAGGKRIVVEFLQGNPPVDPTTSLEPLPVSNVGEWGDLLDGVPLGCQVPPP